MPRLGELTLQKIPFTHIMHFTLTPGSTDVLVTIIKAGCIPLPYRVERIGMSVDPAPGGVNSVSFTLSNGVDSMTVTCTGVELSNINEVGFDVEPLTQDLTLHYTEDAPSASNQATITICRRYT